MFFTKCETTGKNSHRTEEVAKKQAKNYRKRYGSKMNVYYCVHCLGYHIGHNRKKPKRKVLYLKHKGNII